MQQGTFSLFNSAVGGWWVKCPPPFKCIPARSNEGVLGINIFESVCLHDKVIPKGILIKVEGGVFGYIPHKRHQLHVGCTSSGNIF